MVDQWFYPVVRFDGSHGVGHRDLLDRRGATVRKDWLAGDATLAQVLNAGRQEIMERWRDYRAAFLARERFKER